MTTRKRDRSNDGEFKPDDKSTPDVNETLVEDPSEVKAESQPAKVDLKVTEEAPTPAPAPKPEQVQTDVRAKLAKKTDNEDVFVPSTSPQLEKDAKELAETKGFEFNRGTSVGARLMARSRQQFPR